MPLCPIRDDNGPTQFWLGSHRRQLDALPDDAAPDVAAVEADVGEAGCFTSFAFGPPGRKFGPGKALEDCVGATTVGVSHAWA